MTPQQVLELLEKVREGKLTPEQGLDRLKNLPFEDLGFARVDHHRTLRQGFPEVIFAPGKTPEQVVAIVKSLLRQKSNILVTRSNQETFNQVHQADKEGSVPRRGPGHLDCSGYEDLRGRHNLCRLRRDLRYPGCRRSGADRATHGEPGRNYL